MEWFHQHQLEHPRQLVPPCRISQQRKRRRHGLQRHHQQHHQPQIRPHRRCLRFHRCPYTQQRRNLTINNGTTFTLAGTSLANAGLLTLNANTTATGHLTLALSPLSTTTLSGGGTILMNLLSASITGAGLTNLDNTIEGSGNISIPMTNKGTIHALDHSFGLWNFGPQPSPLYLNAPIDNTDGSIIIDPMGEIFSNSTITGGTLTTSAGAYLHGNGTLANITLTTGSVLGLDGTNITPHFAGTFTNHGTILVGDTSGSPAFSLAGNTTLTGGGTIILSNVYYSKIIGNFTNLDNTIRGQGNITSTLTNQSTIRAEGGRLSLASINNLGGTLSAAANATLAPNALVSGGNISLDPGSALQGNGTLQNVTLTSGSTWILGPMLNIGTSGYYPMPEGTFTNHGNIVISQYGADSTLTFAPTANTVLIGAGTITLTNATLAHISGGNFTNVDNTIQGTGIISANLTNQSAINATGGNLTFTGIVDNSAGTINIAGNASLLVNGLLSGGNISLSPGSQIGGNGFLDAPTLSGNGTLAVSPFSDASRLSNLTVTPLSSLTIKSNARFGGTLANHGTLTLSPNSSFNLLISANTTLRR